MSLCFHVGQGRAGQDWGNKMPIYSLPCARERGKEMEVPIKIRSKHTLPALLVMLRNELAV